MKLNYKHLKQTDLQIQNQQKSLSKEREKNKKRTKLVDFTDRKNEALTNQKVKSLIDFDEEYSSSIRSIAIEKSSKVNLTSRILNGKMLMFSKLSIKSFVYDLIDVFMFPNEEIIKRFIRNIKLIDVIYTKT